MYFHTTLALDKQTHPPSFPSTGTSLNCQMNAKYVGKNGEVTNINIKKTESGLVFENVTFFLYHSIDENIDVYAKTRYGEPFTDVTNIRMPLPVSRVLYPWPTIWVEKEASSGRIADLWKAVRPRQQSSRSQTAALTTHFLDFQNEQTAGTDEQEQELQSEEEDDEEFSMDEDEQVIEDCSDFVDTDSSASSGTECDFDDP